MIPGCFEADMKYNDCPSITTDLGSATTPAECQQLCAGEEATPLCRGGGTQTQHEIRPPEGGGGLTNSRFMLGLAKNRKSLQKTYTKKIACGALKTRGAAGENFRKSWSWK